MSHDTCTLVTIESLQTFWKHQLHLKNCFLRKMRISHCCELLTWRQWFLLQLGIVLVYEYFCLTWFFFRIHQCILHLINNCENIWYVKLCTISAHTCTHIKNKVWTQLPCTRCTTNFVPQKSSAVSYMFYKYIWTHCNLRGINCVWFL